MINILLIQNKNTESRPIKDLLETHAFAVTPTATKGTGLLEVLHKVQPDIILLDDEQVGPIGSITAKLISKQTKLPIVVLVNNDNQAIFEKYRDAYPYAFVYKPIVNEKLVRTIEVIHNRIRFDQSARPRNELNSKVDCIYVRDKEKMVKLRLSEILYAQAERNYCKIFTAKKSYLLSVPLKSLEMRINSSDFIRTHRSYLVNKNYIEAIDDHSCFLEKTTIPISRSYKKHLGKSLVLV